MIFTKTGSTLSGIKAVVFLLVPFWLLLFPFCRSKTTIADSNNDFSMLASVFERASKELGDTGNIIGSIHFVDSALANETLNTQAVFKVYGYKLGAYRLLKDYEMAMLYADSMIGLIEKHGADEYKAEYALANFLKGDVLVLQDKLADAYRYYYKARLMGKDAVDTCTLGEYSYRIGMLQYQQVRYVEATESFKNAFIETSTCQLDFTTYYRCQELLANIALSYYQLNNADSSLTYAQKGLDYIQQTGSAFTTRVDFNEMAEGVIYGVMGRVYKHKKDYQAANYYFNKSIAINTKKGYENRDAQNMQLELADTYFLENKLDSLQHVLKIVRQSLNTIDNEKAEVEWSKLMWKYYERTNNLDSAHAMLLSYMEKQDTLQKNSLVSEASEVSHNIEILEDENKIMSLEKENELKTLYLLVFLITSVSAVLIVVFFLYHFWGTKKNLKQLTELNNKIADQKEKLEETLVELEQSIQQKDKIMRVVAHDLRTPTASISMLADLLADETDDNLRREMVKLIKTSSDNSISLINEILETSEIDSNTPLLKEKADINDLIKETVGLLQFKAAEKKQRISLQLTNETKYIHINKEKVARVLNNLIINAVKFSRMGDEIKVKAAALTNSVQIVVEDNGIGIPDDLKDQVFDMFTEAKRVGTDGEKPFGLGLSICKQIVGAHGGKIWFESQEGKGTSFYVQLPVETTSEAV